MMMVLRRNPLVSTSRDRGPLVSTSRERGPLVSTSRDRGLFKALQISKNECIVVSADK